MNAQRLASRIRKAPDATIVLKHVATVVGHELASMSREDIILVRGAIAATDSGDSYVLGLCDALIEVLAAQQANREKEETAREGRARLEL